MPTWFPRNSFPPWALLYPLVACDIHCRVEMDKLFARGWMCCALPTNNTYDDNSWQVGWWYWLAFLVLWVRHLIGTTMPKTVGGCAGVQLQRIRRCCFVGWQIQVGQGGMINGKLTDVSFPCLDCRSFASTRCIPLRDSNLHVVLQFLRIRTIISRFAMPS